MPFAESPRVLDQTREHVIKPGVVGFDFNKFGQFQLSVSKKKKRVTSNSRFKGDQRKQSQKIKIVTTEIKTKGLELFKESVFQSILPQTLDIYNLLPPKKQGFKNICSNQAKQLLKF